MQATPEQLVVMLAGEIGELKVNQIWLTLQLTVMTEQFNQCEIERAGLHSQVLGMEVERKELVARLQELTPEPKPAPTKRVVRKD